jgi:hypothetical protein
MLVNITILIVSLVVLNLLLLKFSCNKTVKQQKPSTTPLVLKPQPTIQLATEPLAPTGS